MKFDKILYSMVHIIKPFTFFIAFFLWGHFILSKPVWENVTDSLSIVAIYYMLVSFLWLANMKSIHKGNQETEEM
ncbi:hypothetical protein [Evansella halocellulosilytica]|uniref:hypothetical protein n=1 Tax=Evansella halocellulosilytica TaxID=2011013 RepID=UPI000BB7FAFF|nr:hypothetical protein [Evansella halocellulosilytica]